ncbi:MAG: UPF0182 family protein, partial [Elusimicrobia bacterium]|nr:UPF0182 family protein [Elusimicrobiota bacterium]
FRLPAWVGALAAGAAALFLGFVFVDPWAVAKWWASPAPASFAYHDPLFGKDLGFYMFRLPFYELAAGWAAGLALAALAVYGAAVFVNAAAPDMRGWRSILGGKFPETWEKADVLRPSPWAPILAPLQGAAAVFLFFFALNAFFDRYHLLYASHRFLFGADYVDAKLGIPLDWFRCFLSAGLGLVVLAAPRKDPLILEAIGEGGSPLARLPAWLAPVVGVGFAVALLVPALVQQAVRVLYVQPNELTLERPYIVDHVNATLAGFNLAQNAHEEPFAPRPTNTLDVSKYPDIEDNILLWDRQPFRDNVTQVQTLRPYYAFPTVDTDRYQVGGSVRQVLIAARALETRLLPQKAQTWVNLNLQYSHGYGAVAALVNSATDEGAPDLALKDAPPQSSLKELSIKRPQIYFGENTDHPVFVDSDQQEFDYPKGDDNAYNTYDGSGGIPVGGAVMRVAAALAQGDANILLTRYLTPASKLMIHRQIEDRVSHLAPFLTLDPDPYLVIDGSGRLFWMLDAYTATDRYPYSQPLELGDSDVNYMRNAVKITVDAYNGTVHFYVFDEQDPILKTYRTLFPGLFEPRAAMPADLLAHIRYPQLIFRAQSETYRTFHMRDPQVFYNKEDQWDVAKQVADA